MLNLLISNWKNAWTLKRFRTELFSTLALFFGTLFLFSRFIKWIELREGVALNDPILAILNPVDLTWFTFAFIYSGIILSVIVNAVYPTRFLLGLQVYTLMVVVRAAAMYAIPLDPPVAMIPLEDPFVEIIGTGQTLTRDLFFSGHTATMVVLFLCVAQRSVKIFLIIGAGTVAVCLLLQHVHYTIDVVAAPFFAYGAYRAVVLIRKKIDLNFSIV
jgi:hypothetical protein